MAIADCFRAFLFADERIYRTVKKNYKWNFYGNHLAVDG
jgi:hypothetical protein